MKNTTPRPIWPAFRPGMSAPELCKACGQTMNNVHRVLTRAINDHVLRREKEGHVFRYYPYGDGAPSVPAAAPMRPLRQAFAGPAVIPVRSGGRVMPINLNRGFV